MAAPYVWATSTGATVDVYAPSRGATLGASSAVNKFLYFEKWNIMN